MTYDVFSGVLFYCISPTQRHARCMDIALAFGSDVNCQTSDGIPVFLKACETSSENEEMCLSLLKKGADPNSKQEVSTINTATVTVMILFSHCIGTVPQKKLCKTLYYNCILVYYNGD